MFRDMREGTVEELDRMVDVARPWLKKALAGGWYHHWLAVVGNDDGGDGDSKSGGGPVVDSNERVAGGGGVLLSPWPANPHDPCVERAIILNVYTEQEFRRRGVAREVMQAILGWVKERGLRSVNLHASDEGRRLYENLGFTTTNEMRLRF
jgi:GNAT superfamily N-acetyltransferase